MTDSDAAARLEQIANSGDFVAESSDLVDEWSSIGAGVDVVDDLLAFVERHPDLDFGSPGPLVHFAERFRGAGYEGKLLESVERKPTPLTVWMLNRLINGTRMQPTRGELVGAMKRVSAHPLADDETRDLAQRFVERAG